MKLLKLILNSFHTRSITIRNHNRIGFYLKFCHAQLFINICINFFGNYIYAFLKMITSTYLNKRMRGGVSGRKGTDLRGASSNKFRK